jgi:hypothetical protein
LLFPPRDFGQKFDNAVSKETQQMQGKK